MTDTVHQIIDKAVDADKAVISHTKDWTHHDQVSADMNVARHIASIGTIFTVTKEN